MLAMLRVDLHWNIWHLGQLMWIFYIGTFGICSILGIVYIGTFDICSMLGIVYIGTFGICSMLGIVYIGTFGVCSILGIVYTGTFDICSMKCLIELAVVQQVFRVICMLSTCKAAYDFGMLYLLVISTLSSRLQVFFNSCVWDSLKMPGT